MPESLPRESDDRLLDLLNALPVTFDPLADPNWQPTREHYEHLRQAARQRIASLERELAETRERLENATDRASRNRAAYRAMLRERDEALAAAAKGHARRELQALAPKEPLCACTLRYERNCDCPPETIASARARLAELARDTSLEADKPEMALRPHHEFAGEMDDIVVRDVTMFRAEQMSDDSWWMACIFANGEELRLDVRREKKPPRVAVRVTPPAVWVDMDAEGDTDASR